jgi:hypothetical protein
VQVLRPMGFGAATPQDLVNGANGMLGAAATQANNWPYWWLQPRANTQYKQPIASIVAPPNATVTEVLALQVPVGFRFILRGILQTFQSGTGGAPIFVDGSGDILWTIDLDQPTGSLSLSGFGLPDFTNMAEQRGSLQNGFWRLEGYTVFDAYQTLRYKVTTTATIAPGAPNYITCGFFGWFEKALDPAT